MGVCSEDLGVITRAETVRGVCAYTDPRTMFYSVLFLPWLKALTSLGCQNYRFQPI